MAWLYHSMSLYCSSCLTNCYGSFYRAFISWDSSEFDSVSPSTPSTAPQWSIQGSRVTAGTQRNSAYRYFYFITKDIPMRKPLSHHRCTAVTEETAADTVVAAVTIAAAQDQCVLPTLSLNHDCKCQSGEKHLSVTESTGLILWALCKCFGEARPCRNL